MTQIVTQDDDAEGSARIERQRGVFLRILDQQNSKLADVYRGAVHIVDGPSFPARAVFVAHAVRELRNGLPRTFAPPELDEAGEPIGKLDHHKHLSALGERWDPVAAKIAESRNLIDPKPEIAVPWPVANELNSLIEKDRAVGERNHRRFLAMCVAVSSEAMSWTGNESLASRWMRIEAQGIAHVAAADDDERAIALFRELEDITLNIFDYAPERAKRIVALAESATPANLAEALLQVVTFNDAFTFYGALRKPELLPALRLLGALVDTTNELQAFWPPADYLASIADAVPSDVADVLLSIRLARPGPARALADIALRLPDEHLARVADRAKWLHEPSIAFLENYRRIVQRMADSDHVDIAFKLARRVVRIESVSPSVPFPGVEHDDAVARIGDDWLSHALEAILPIIRVVDHGRTINLLAEKLNNAIAIEQGALEPRYSGWMDSLLREDSSRHGAKQILAGAVCSESLKLAERDVEHALRVLRDEHNESGIYGRMESVCLLRFGNREQIVAHLSNADQWIRGGPEHLALVESAFPELTQDQKSALSKIAFEGVTAYFEPLLKNHGYSEEDGKEVIRRNLIARFGSAAKDVPQEYHDVLASSSDPEPPPRPIPTLAEMEALTPSQLVELLKSWLPAESDRWPGAWSIGAHFHAIFERNADSWLSQQDVFNQIPLYFTGSALNALQTYRRNNQGIDDERVLKAIESSVARLQGLLENADQNSLAIAYQAGMSAGVLLADIVRAANSEGVIRRVVAVSRSLSAIPEDEDRREKQTSLSAPDDSIGEPKAVAVFALAEALVSARRNALAVADIEEVYDSLSRDESLAVRAACGQYFNWFAQVFSARDEEWAQRLFLSDDVERNRAAWNGYVFHTAANLNTLRLLRPAYIARINELHPNAAGEDEADARSTSARVYQNLTIFHVWTLLANRVEKIGEDGSLAELMLDNATADQIEHLLSTIGPSFHEPQTADDHNEMVNSEAIKLWATVRHRVEEGRLPVRTLSSLPLWLKAPLPIDWRFSEAEAGLESGEKYTVNDWATVSALVDLARFNRLRALRLLERLARSGSISAHTGLQMEAGPLLRSALEGDDEEQHLARSVNSILVNNGRPNLLDP